jgi:hypothetical protein
MTRNDDFDRVLEAWLGRQAPPQAPDRVLDAALQRAEAVPQRRGWLRRLAGGTPMTRMLRIAAVAAVLAVAALIGFQFSSLPNEIGASPTPLPSASEPSASARPSLDPASPSVEPSAEPSAAALVVRLLGGGEAGRVHLVTVMDDGRVITSGPSGADPPLERRLTPAGVELVRTELARTGLTEESAEYLPIPNPGAEPPAYGGAGPSLEVGAAEGGEPVVVSWFLFGDTEEDYFQPQPEAEALEELAARLTSLETWIPAEGWTDDTGVPHQPDSYEMTILFEAWGGTADELPVEFTAVSWPLPGEMVDFGEVPTVALPFEIRCGTVDAADGEAVIRALEAAGAEPGFEGGLVFRLGDRGGSRQITITLVPSLLATQIGC